jgi:Trypsin-like peptidase domain
MIVMQNQVTTTMLMNVFSNFHVVRDAKFAQVAILTKSSGGNKALPRIGASQQQQLPNPFEAPVSVADVLPYTSMRPSTSSDTFRSVYKARVVGVDPSKDIAVLKVEAPKSELFPITVGTSTGLKAGQQALAIGNPFGLDHTLTSGIISGLGREVRSPIGRPISNVIQSDCAINPGNSGGPLLDSSGRMIGMNTAIYSPSGASAGIGFAIPADTVKLIVDTLIRDGQGKRVFF